MPSKGREAREAERKKQRKNVADAEKTFQKLQEASTVEALTEAVRSGVQLKSYLPALEKALPAAQIRLRKMRDYPQFEGAEGLIILDPFLNAEEHTLRRLQFMKETGARHVKTA